MRTNVDMCDTMHRWSSYGLRPSLGIRRYLSANLPSRLRSGPPHSTQCVGAASTLDHIFRFAVRAPERFSHGRTIARASAPVFRQGAPGALARAVLGLPTTGQRLRPARTLRWAADSKLSGRHLAFIACRVGFLTLIR